MCYYLDPSGLPQGSVAIFGEFLEPEICSPEFQSIVHDWFLGYLKEKGKTRMQEIFERFHEFVGSQHPDISFSVAEQCCRNIMWRLLDLKSISFTWDLRLKAN
jgi:hypothetical protein